MEIKNILIVGGSGIIGSNLILKLSRKNKIFVFDKKKLNTKKKNIFFIKGDCSKSFNYNKLPKKIDIVFYLVGIKGGKNSLNLNTLEKYIYNNFNILVKFLNILKKKKTKKIIFTSTEHVYGDNDKSNNKCMHLETFPKNYYGFSKLLAEKYLFNFYKNTSINVDILRIPRVIYPNDNSVISVIIKKTYLNKKIILKKAKSNFNFIFIDDLIDAMMISSKQINSKFRILNIFNNSKPVSLLQIVNKIKKIYGGNKKVLLDNSAAIDHNPINLNISNKFAKKSLSWQPKFSFQKIINKLTNTYELRK
tara:strand:+ start:981 stop:1898 length:918 start_codon:yes stop_codon:yes gene_type:complete